MADPRVEQYARLLVERSLEVQPGWQVVIRTQPLARPLLEELVRQIAQRGAYPIIRLGFTMWPEDVVFGTFAPEEILDELPPIDLHTIEQMDARITLEAPENTRDKSRVSPERRAFQDKAVRAFYRRSTHPDFPWASCQYPTPALAQDAGISTEEFAEFLFGAVLRDWDAEGRRMQRYAARFEAAETVRIVGAGTDLSIRVAGRQFLVDDGKKNLPGGEFFTSPVEDGTEGEITFAEFPALSQGGTKVEGIRLVFRGGRVVEASAAAGEEALLGVLDTDAGARVVGELGIGCNDAITRYMLNTLFDEKMGGTIHLALGASYEFVGGRNESAIHWDIVKDLRTGGRIEVDGELVQENGRWLI